MPNKRCACCGDRPSTPAHAPFCSEGCRSRDLNRWLSEAYVLPAPAAEDELSAPSPLDNDEPPA